MEQLAQKKKAAALAGTADTVEDDFPTQHTSHTGHQTTRNHTTRELPRVTAPIEKPLKNKGTKCVKMFLSVGVMCDFDWLMSLFCQVTGHQAAATVH